MSHAYSSRFHHVSYHELTYITVKEVVFTQSLSCTKINKMENKVACELCGGADFYQEAGFYYCNECLTQTQEIQEHTLEVPMQEQSAIIEPPKRKSSRTSKSQERKQQITSWECYNYIILGLVEELIQLGAKSELKPTVMNLWFTYLQKLEVLHDDPLEPPRLPPFNNAGDAEAIYGHIPRRKKIKRRRHSNSSTTTDYSNISTRNQNLIRGKKRRAMAITEYEERMSLGQSADVSLANQTLQSLKSDSDLSTHIKPLKFNKSAEQVLMQIMTKDHLEAHKEDAESEMNCHFSRRRTPRTYAGGPMVLTRNKLYAIIYLGLLLVKDDIQLADMLSKAYARSAGYDLKSSFSHIIPPQEKNIDFTRKVVKLRTECCGTFASRSGFAAFHSIDIGGTPFTIRVGDRIAQLICERKFCPLLFDENEFPSDTERGIKK